VVVESHGIDACGSNLPVGTGCAEPSVERDELRVECRNGVADPCHVKLQREASLVLGATCVSHRPTGAAAEAGVLDPAPRLEVEEQLVGQVGVEPVANGDARGRREAHHSGRVKHQIL